MAHQFYGQSCKTVVKCKGSLEYLLPSLKHEDYLAMVSSCNWKQVYSMIEIKDFTSSHYVYNRDNIGVDGRYLHAIEEHTYARHA